MKCVESNVTNVPGIQEVVEATSVMLGTIAMSSLLLLVTVNSSI
jgi:hypothetical protein